MGVPAVVAGNAITGTCTNHMIPSASGTQPAGPLPFSAPLSSGLSNNVFIGGRLAALMGSSGINASVHAGIVDGIFASPTGQVGRVTSGSQTVLINNKPAATTNSTATCCVVPATGVGPGVPTVLIG
jgi:uncharacterized Zn-binding protein involved in type VI secretion